MAKRSDSLKEIYERVMKMPPEEWTRRAEEAIAVFAERRKKESK